LVSSYSWEVEGLIQKFPGVDVKFWGFSLSLEGGLDVQGVGPVSGIEVS